MCIRDSLEPDQNQFPAPLAPDSGCLAHAQLVGQAAHLVYACLLYTSDAADERSSVDLGGRRIIKKKNKERISRGNVNKKRYIHISEKKIQRDNKVDKNMGST